MSHVSTSIYVHFLGGLERLTTLRRTLQARVQGPEGPVSEVPIFYSAKIENQHLQLRGYIEEPDLDPRLGFDVERAFVERNEFWFAAASHVLQYFDSFRAADRFIWMVQPDAPVQRMAPKLTIERPILSMAFPLWRLQKLAELNRDAGHAPQMLLDGMELSRPIVFAGSVLGPVVPPGPQVDTAELKEVLGEENLAPANSMPADRESDASSVKGLNPTVGDVDLDTPPPGLTPTGA